jgi:hypothetical protein
MLVKCRLIISLVLLDRWLEHQLLINPTNVPSIILTDYQIKFQYISTLIQNHQQHQGLILFESISSAGIVAVSCPLVHNIIKYLVLCSRLIVVHAVAIDFYIV